MSRKLHRPILDVNGLVVPVKEGGSQADTLVKGAIELEMLTYDMIDGIDQIPSLDAAGRLPNSIIPAGLTFETLHIEGPEIVKTGSHIKLYITDYDQYKTYTVTASDGFAAQADGVIHFTAPLTVGVVTITVNGRDYTVTVDDRYIDKPKFTSPLPDNTNIGSGFTVHTDTMSVVGGRIETVLSTSNKAANDNLGLHDISISYDGLRIAVGATKRENGGVADAGAVYIFRNDSGTWVEEAMLQPPSQYTSDYFGISVDLTDNGDRVVIGAQFYNPSDIGAIYVYSRSGTTWTLEQGLTNAGTYQLGSCVKIAGDGSRIIAGSHGDNISTFNNAGRVHVWVRSGTVWSIESVIANPYPSTAAYFGIRIDIDVGCNYLVVGASNETYINASEGMVYLFKRTGAAWAFVARWTPQDGLPSGQFGTHVSMSRDGSIITAGKPYADINGKTDTGCAYVYSYNGISTVALVQRLENSVQEANSLFGIRCLISNDKTKIAIYNHFASKGSHVVIYNLVGGVWVEDQKVYSHYEEDYDGNLGHGIEWFPNSQTLIATDPSHTVDNIYACGSFSILDLTYHVSTDWELSTDPAFTNIIQQSLADTTNHTSWSVSDLALDTDYYLRSRYTATQYGTSEWSDVQHFKTRQSWLPINEMQSLSAYDKQASEFYGTEVSITEDGLRCVISAASSKVASMAARGAAYVYIKVNGIWELEQKLIASDGYINDNLGVSCAISRDGTTIVLGAYTADVGGIVDAGAVYVYTRSGSTWTQTSKITYSALQASDIFGYRVDINSNGTKIIIGSHGRNVSALADSGMAVRYTWNGSIWGQSSAGAPTPTTAAYFGSDVVMSADGLRYAVAAQNDSNGGVSNCGVVYVYTGDWVLEATLVASDKATNDVFGVCIDMTDDGSRMIIGSYHDNHSSLTQPGSVYVFVRSGSTWTQEAKIIAPDAVTNHGFGSAVSINAAGDIIAISAATDSLSGISNSGAIYLYTREGSVWTFQKKLYLSNKAINDYLAASLQLSTDGSLLLAGVRTKDPSGIVDAGEAFFFE